MDYMTFVKSKVALAEKQGFDIDPSEVNPILKPHQRDIVCWAISGGRRAIFAAFGLGKTMMQIEIVRLVLKHKGGMGLIVHPLGVRQEFMRDSRMLGVNLKFIRRIEECDDPNGIYLTNYETVRDGKLDPRKFTCTSLDEASCLRGFGGTKTFREFMRLFAGDGKTLNKRERGLGVPYRFVATATPSPNEYIEILAYSTYLGVMDVGQGKTRFFKRDSTKADKLTLHAHKEREFWLWVSTWAMFIQRPSDLGYADTGYAMPEMIVRWHEVSTDHSKAGFDKHGQGKLLANSAIGIQDSAREKRESLPSRIEKMMELREQDPSAHRIIWHDLEAERHAIQNVLPESVAVYGNQSLDDREDAIIGFSEGRFQELSAKPVVAGSGCNFQHHCHWAIFLGIGFKFNDFIQAVHRIYRYMQNHPVTIDLIYTEAEREIKKQLERKWEQHNNLVKQMTDIIKEFGLNQAGVAGALVRGIGVERVEVTGEHFTLVNNDCVLETARMDENSVHLILTSIPFSTQYEYSPNYCDFGHSDNNDQFFKQMDFLTPNLFRALKPGRLCAIHVKDRIVPGGMTGLGFQTVYPFHARCIEHYCKHGFGYMGMKTIVTDVVRENNQTYRLGWTEQCKDGSKMGVGMPEYLLIFRKPQTSAEKSYSDEPVVKSKKEYSRSRWQIDAHGFARSSGNRLLRPEELESLTHQQIFNIFKDHSLKNVYDFEHHVKIGEAIDACGRLPVTFMLLQPQSWSPEVWTDITRMLTLNGAQSAQGREMHLCPMQFDIADRAIEQWTMLGETVLDPFGGLMTVPYRAVMKKRKGIGIELSKRYFIDGCHYCAAAELEAYTPTLFDIESVMGEK